MQTSCLINSRTKDTESSSGKYRHVPVVLLLLVALLVNAPAFADNPCGPDHGGKSKHAEFFEQHQAELRNQLQLTTAQESKWKTFIAAMKPAYPIGQHDKWSDQSKLTTPDRFDHRLVIMKARLNQMTVRAQALRRFYNQLTATQQHILDDYFRSLDQQLKQA